jgi:hypothetical protein
MTHQVAPIILRLNKALLWKSNTILTSNSGSSSNNLVAASSTYNNIPFLLKHKLRRLRYLIVKSTIFYSSKTQTVWCKALIMPRVKTRPISDGRGIFTRNTLYKPYKWANLNTQNMAKNYISERRLKVFKFPLKKKKQINKWLSRRMLRGSKLYTNKLLKRNSRWYVSRVRTNQQINCNKISHSISNILNQRFNLLAMNIFCYLAHKQMVGYRSHQEHLWHKKYRKYRFHYDNYYDIVNSLFIISLVKNSETLLLDILRFMMPRIRKIKRFMMFLDAVLKNMPQLQKFFLCFRILLTGKIRGGTERTKSLIVGFGYLPYQSISIEGSSLFISYPHKYGEFGIKLILNRVS